MTTLTPVLSKTSRASSLHAPVFVFCAVLGLFGGCASEPESHVVSAPPPPPPTATSTTTTTISTPAAVQQTSSMSAPGGNTVIVTQAPPAPLPETAMARPSPDDVWIPGHWTWNDNRYEWMAGNWALPPSPGAVWVAPRWEPTNGGYRFYEGYWN